VGTIRPDWLSGQPSSSASTELLQTLRQASPEEASAKVVELLSRRVAPQSIWDGIFAAAGELLMRRPGILSLHALTSTNALHYAFQNSSNDETRRLLLLQNAAFLTLFRGGGNDLKPLQLDELRAANEPGASPPTLEEIFADISHDRLVAARKTLAWLEQNPTPTEFITVARRLVFLKGNNAHDYKFSSAVLEDYQNVSPAWRGRYLAASVFNLRGSGDPDNALVRCTRSVLGS